jgi:hypothetical protein
VVFDFNWQIILHDVWMKLLLLLVLLLLLLLPFL